MAEKVTPTGNYSVGQAAMDTVSFLSSREPTVRIVCPRTWTTSPTQQKLKFTKYWFLRHKPFVKYLPAPNLPVEKLFKNLKSRWRSTSVNTKHQTVSSVWLSCSYCLTWNSFLLKWMLSKRDKMYRNRKLQETWKLQEYCCCEFFRFGTI